MTPRLRLTVALAVLGAALALAGSALSYVATRDRLMREVDRTLEQRSTSFLAAHSEPFTFPENVGSAPSWLRLDVEAQILDRDGSVRDRSGSVAAPVSPAELAVARGGGAPRTRTVEVGGRSYRMRTVAFPSGGAVQLTRDLTETDRVLAGLRSRLAVIAVAVMLVGALVGWLAASIRATLRRMARTRERQRRLAEDAGHELRTPLTSLRTNVEVLERHPELATATREAIFADLRSELGEVEHLVGELVQLAGDEHADEPATTVRLDDLVQRCAARAGRRHGRSVRVTGRAGPVPGRPAALERVVANLLDNAAKFSPPGTPIEIRLSGGRVTVRDHGPGFEPQDLPRVFDRFHRSTVARQLPGSGLGLAIVRQIVEAHGGRVFAANAPDGGGMVGFELPSERAPAPAPDGAMASAHRG